MFKKKKIRKKEKKPIPTKKESLESSEETSQDKISNTKYVTPSRFAKNNSSRIKFSKKSFVSRKK